MKLSIGVMGSGRGNLTNEVKLCAFKSGSPSKGARS